VNPLKSEPSNWAGARPAIRLGVACLSALALMAVLATSASAGRVIRFQGTFGSAGQPTFSKASALAIDAGGNLLVVDEEAGTLSRYKPDGTPDEFAALHSNAISEAGGIPLEFAGPRETQIAVDTSSGPAAGDIYVAQPKSSVVDIFSDGGDYLGSLSGTTEGPFASVGGVAVDASGDVYVSDSSNSAIDRFAPTASPVVNGDSLAAVHNAVGIPQALAPAVGGTSDSLFVLNFFQAVEKVNADTSTLEAELQPDTGRTTLTTNGETGEILVATGKSVRAYAVPGGSFDETQEFEVGSQVRGLAVGPGGQVYVSREGDSTLERWIYLPTPEPDLAEPSAVTPTSALLHGSVDPEGEVLTECEFEYGPVTEIGFANSASCSPSAEEIPPGSTPVDVSASIGDLRANGRYQFRLRAANGNGSSVSTVGTFSATGPPQIGEVRASGATSNSATLEATVNPRGFATSYRFEWGPTKSYGHQVPIETEGEIGSGTASVLVKAPIAELSPGSAYHYTVVATNSLGSVASPDQVLETVNSCGLPEERCFELVSPRGTGPIDLPGIFSGQIELHFQASAKSGALAYVSESGVPSATKGAEILSKAERGPAEWSSTQLSPELTALNETSTLSSVSSNYLFLNEELTCGVLASNQPLTEDAGTRAVVEAGGSNLYLQKIDGLETSYTALTRLPPENPTAGEGVVGGFNVRQASQNCETIVFDTTYVYPGVEADSDINHLYEWRRGNLKSVGYVPSESGEVLEPAHLGASAENGTASSFNYDYNGVSGDGSRVFFTARRLMSSNPGEIGTEGLFVREDGSRTRDVSLSETSVPDDKPNFKYATKSGSRVFFTAPAGLTDSAHTEGRDLYEFDLDTNDLTDLTPSDQPGGAEVEGFIGASTDGAHVYFVARAQLIPGSGPTRAENRAAATFSIYGEADGQIQYVGHTGAGQNVVSLIAGGPQTARVSPDGRYLLFESSADLTGYDGGGVAREAYLFDSAIDTGALTCISCRQDGAPSLSPRPNSRIANSEHPTNSPYPARALTIRSGKPIVFFSQFDALAPKAEEGENNVYEWAHGQVFLIAAEPHGLQPPLDPQTVGQEAALFVGSSEGGTDLYFATPQTLNWEDGDARSSIYDARIGGGHPAPPPPPIPCNSTEELNCQGLGSNAGQVPGAATQTFSGPGNQKSGKNRSARPGAKGKKKHRRHVRKKKHQGKKNKTRHAKGDRRGRK
jgi:hypothetical protein